MTKAKTKPAAMTAAKPVVAVKSVRLTNDIKDDFVIAVMADVPAVDYEQQIRDAIQKATLAALPPAIKKMTADPVLAAYLRREMITMYSGGISPLPKGKWLSFTAYTSGSKDTEKLAQEIAEPFCRLWAAQEEKRDELKLRLRAILNTSTTTKQVAEALPEFARYLPKDEAASARNLPAVANTVAEFVKAGWPKGRK